MEYIITTIRGSRLGQHKIKRVAVAAARHLHDHFIPHHRNNYHPHILGHRALGLFSALLLSVKIFTLALISFGPVAPAFSSAITTENIITLTNESRQAYNLPGLKENQSLDQAAQAKANDMLAKGYFSHNTPDNKTPWDFIINSGYDYLMAGENLAVNFTEGEAVEQAWMNSPGHKANILNKNFEEIGIGIAQGEYQGHNAIFVVQMFGTPAEQKIQLTNTPTPVMAKDVPEPSPVKQVPKPAVQTASGSSKTAMPAAASPELTITNPEVSVDGTVVKISATISDPAVKAVVYFGQKGIMLEPKANNLWVGQTELQNLSSSDKTVRITAFDLKGSSQSVKLADFSSSTVGNFNVLGVTDKVKANWMGKVFDPKNFEQKFYLLFIAGILSSLIIAIGVKRHIQHLSLVTNSSFVIILASLLWMAG